MNSENRAVCLMSILMLIAGTAHADRGSILNRKVLNISSIAWDTVVDDYREFYSLNRLKRMGITLGAGAAMAHTNTDQLFQKWHQTEIRNGGMDDISGITKHFGEYRYLLPVTLATAFIDNIFEGTAYNRTVGRWGKRTMRAYLLGTPVLWTSQSMIGASRPEEHRGSKWRPFQDANGVSGHAYVGAVPFLIMAGMTGDNRILKTFYYAASTLTAFSRINDDAHYFSQAALGWYLAWEAAATVLDRENRETSYTVRPLPVTDGYGISVGLTW